MARLDTVILDYYEPLVIFHISYIPFSGNKIEDADIIEDKKIKEQLEESLYKNILDCSKPVSEK